MDSISLYQKMGHTVCHGADAVSCDECFFGFIYSMLSVEMNGVIGLIRELEAFDCRVKKPLPPAIKKWRERWVKAIKKEWVVLNAYETRKEKCPVYEEHF